MKPVEFKEQNCVYGKHQPEYLAMPANKGLDGKVTSCWALTRRERLRALLTGRIWCTLLTFGGPPQPQLLHAKNPFTRVPEGDAGE